MFHTYVASVLSGCCICFTHMLQVFYLDVAYVFQWFQVFSGVFASVSDTCFKCFSCFGGMFQVWLIGCCKNRSGFAYIAMVIYTYMLQAFVPNISLVFSVVCCKHVYLDVAYVLHICCKCFIRMLRKFCNDFSSVFRCFCKCFRCMF